MFRDSYVLCICDEHSMYVSHIRISVSGYGTPMYQHILLINDKSITDAHVKIPEMIHSFMDIHKNNKDSYQVSIYLRNRSAMRQSRFLSRIKLV